MQSSNCTAFAALFTPSAVYESPVGSGAVVGVSAIYAACQTWNGFVNPLTVSLYPLTVNTAS